MRPLSNELYTIPKAEIFFRKSGQPAFQNLGDADAFTLEIAVEESERYANNRGTRTLVKRTVTQVDASVSMTLVQMTAFARAASMMADAEVMSQAAVQAAEFEETFAIDGIYKTPHLKISNLVFSDDVGPLDPQPVADVDYVLDADAGIIESITLDGMMTVSYAAAAIDGGHKSGIANNPTLRGEFMIRGVNDEGVRSLVRVWDLEVRPASARALISESDNGTIELSGSAYPVAGKPQGYSIGSEETL
ncbi:MULTISPECIES: hypothetical protein [unclassified Yoonia]|uniref:phage tail tube protein n=1 Tax=unclassified Yoonia TaxID=2629118 RepID=UPI002AFE30FA|nr:MULTISPECIES: hypothetical protein [unclassified Yoonia]